MFSIRFRFVEVNDTLREIDADTFDVDFGNVSGQICLNFNGKLVNWIHQDVITSEMVLAGCFKEDLLFSWFENLNRSVKEIELERKSSIPLIESHGEIELRMQNDILNIGLFYPRHEVKQSLGKAKNGLKFETVWVNEHYEWKDVFVSFEEYRTIIRTESENFIIEIEKYFPKILSSESFKRLRHQFI